MNFPALSLSPAYCPEDHQDLSVLSLEEKELLTPSMEVSPSLSVCGNIHQAQYYPFWTDVLKCGSWHKNILREGLKLDFINDILPSSYDEKNNLSARREPAFVPPFSRHRRWRRLIFRRLCLFPSGTIGILLLRSSFFWSP